MKRRGWHVAAGASLVLHALFLVLPVGRDVEARTAPSRIRLTTRNIPDPPPEPEPEAKTPTPPEPPPSAAPPPPKRRRRAPPPSRKEAPSVPPPAETPPTAPDPGSKAPASDGEDGFDPLGEDLDLLPSGRKLRPGGGTRTPRRLRPPPGLEPSGGGTYVYQHRGFKAEITRDGRVTFDGKSSLGLLKGGLGATFDTTEMVTKMQGQDPFTADKLAFLQRTASFRTELAERAKEDRLKRAVMQTLGRLRSIWSRPAPARLRRKALFEVWDACLESGTETEVLAGNQIRASVLSFVARVLPAGGPDAYSEQELEALNERRSSSQRFEPYL